MDPQSTQAPSTKKSPALLIGIIAIVLLAAGGFFFYTQSQSTTANPAMEANESTEQMNTTDTMTAEPTTDTGESMTDEVAQTIEVEGGSFFFKPNEIRVKKGQQVTINFTNSGGLHDFVIDEFDVATKQLQAGGKESITFTPDKVGTFEFYCSVGQHRQMGMKGNLIVE